MNDDEFELFLTSANAELKEKQAHLTQTYGFGSHKRWMFENDKAKLQFFNQDDRLVIEADIDFQSKLRAPKDAAHTDAAESKQYEFVLSNAIETVDTSADDHRSTLTDVEEYVKRKKKQK